MSRLSGEEFLTSVAAVAAIATLLLLAETSRRILKARSDLPRIIVHAGTGLLIAFSPLFFQRAFPLILIGGVFVILNALALGTDIPILGRHGCHPSFGTVFYPAAFLTLTAFLWHRSPPIVTSAMLVMAFGDMAAALIGGSRSHPRRYAITSDGKSLEGSAAMFIASFSALLGAAFLLPTASRLDITGLETIPAIVLFFSTALYATVWEAASSRGSDNLSIPLSTAFLLFLCLPDQRGVPSDRLAVATVLAISAAFAAWAMRLLTVSGAVGAFLLAVLVFTAGGWSWAVPILTFFILSSVVSRIGKERKNSLQTMTEKTSTRDFWQVAANGGVAGCIVVLSVVIPDERWYFAYLGTLAAVASDTFSTEIGVLSRGNPRHILNFRPVPAGSSGGVSLTGVAGGIVGAALTALSGALFDREHLFRPLPILGLMVVGFLSSLVDSLAGATLQAQYRCEICGATTERRSHCGFPSALRSGRKSVTNDTVNVACAVSGAFLGWIIGCLPR
ncbi:MAG: DUF92 domain-containing protein [Bacteroidota bacterium]|nr:DUF92 domain-containing protein [Bacteroidota bacterium]